MKKKVVSKIFAGLLAASMVVGIAACGNEDGGSSSTPQSSTPSTSGGSQSTGGTTGGDTTGGDTTGGDTNGGSTEFVMPEIDTSFTKVSVDLPLTSNAITEHTAGESQEYDDLVKFLNDYTGMDITWNFLASDSYYDNLDLAITAANVSDVVVTGYSATFMKAAQESDLFWDLAPYLDAFDNLGAIPQSVRNNASVNGKLYALPRSRNLGRNGVGWRVDWLENLNMDAPTNLDEFYDMLYAFTYNDPDGNGEDDTTGLLICNYSGYWDMIETWYGVPNGWGLDANGNLIPKQLTDEWKAAVTEFRKWYSEGLVTKDFDTVPAGNFTSMLREEAKHGVGVDVLDNLRKVETYFMDNNPSYEFTVAGAIPGNDGVLRVLPTSGYNGGIAVSKVNVKTPEQLMRVLQFLNDMMDEEPRMLIDSGFENKTWHKDENGYMVYYTADELSELGVGTSYRDGFNQVLTYFNAPEHAVTVTTDPSANSDIVNLENYWKAENEKWTVPNYGAGYVSDYYIQVGSTLDTIIGNARTNYIKGTIDEVQLDAQIQVWLDAGMQKVIDEMNAAYHAAGN